MAVTPDMLETFVRQPPPRQVPPDIYKKALRQSPGVIMLIGFYVLVLGSFFTFIFFPIRLLDDIRLQKSGVVTRGMVLSRERTPYSENNRNVARYRFKYDTPAGTLHGVCYSSSVTLDQGMEVPVLYLKEQPAIARIKGCRLSKFGWGGVFVVILPCLGGIIFIFSRRSRNRIRSLLRYGTFAVGQISEIKDIRVRVNKQPVYRVYVTFKTGAGQDTTATYPVIGDAAVRMPWDKLNNRLPVGVLHDPANPKRILLIDDLLG